MANPINEETSIGEAIFLKGNPAKTIIQNFLCGREKDCFEGTEVKIGAALKLKGKQPEILPALLTQLNNIPNKAILARR